MKTYKTFIFLLAVLPVLVLASCAGDDFKPKPDITHAHKEINETELLHNFMEKSGNYINQKSTPNIISADDVYKNLKKYHVIDIRKKSDYVAGHIDGAVNVKPEELINYMKFRIEPGLYDKVVIACYSGQKAAYTAGALRLLGYGNVHSMKWGMSSWDKATAEKKWLKRTSNAYVSQLEEKGNPKGPKSEYPGIKTGKTTGYAILEARAYDVLNNSKSYTKSADDVFADPSKYYIINYWNMEDYAKGHIPGAIMYPPKASLTGDTYLSTLPADKPIVIYCYTGQHASYVTAYLRILGYEAYTLAYSANAFMYGKLKTDGIGHAFEADQIKNYPMVTGDKPSKEPVGGKAPVIEEAPAETIPVIINNSQSKEEEGGC